jgi:tetratricopeptide (TPR) repeat protein/AraC-like DNA-binding protein
MFKLPILTIVLFLCPILCAAQKQNIDLRLKAYNFDELQQYIDNANGQTGKMYARAYLENAKAKRIWDKIAQGYKNHIYFEDSYAAKLQYADSMVAAARKATPLVLASSYLTKGAVYYSNKSYKQALEHYLKANGLLQKNDDPYLFHKVAYCIAQVKCYMELYPDAIDLLLPCLAYYKTEDTRAYINTLHLMGICYNRNGQYQLSHKTNQLGITIAAQHNQTELLHYFMHSEGINEFFMGHHDAALKYLKGSVAYFGEKGDFANESVASFYFGKCCLKLGRIRDGIAALEKVHQLFTRKGYIRPDEMEAYRLLANHYRSKNDINRQLFYTDASIVADSVLDSNYKFLTIKLQKGYDIVQLRKDRQRLEQELRDSKEKEFMFIARTGLSIVLLASMLGYGVNRLVKKRRAIAVPLPYSQESTESKPVTSAIKEDLLLVLQKRLEKFERDKKYLGKDMNLAHMAKLLETNTKYVSILIHEYRDKKTPEYLNDLKIDHLVDLLAKDSKARNYTHKALATEIGYSTTNSLHKAFFNRTGVSFTEYLEGLQVKNQETLTDFSEAQNPTGLQPGTS